jgi:hypothetical protein
MALYEDGRLIWQRNLDHGAFRVEAFGASEPTTAVIEQRLTRAGVERMSSYVRSVAAGDGDWKPGVLWGELRLGDAVGVREASWTDAELPARLADPGAWLPASAWADRRIRGYVPARFAVCGAGATRDGSTRDIAMAAVLPLVPTGARDVLTGPPRTTAPWSGALEQGCAVVSLEAARTVAAALDAGGFARADAWAGQLIYRLDANASVRRSGSDHVVLSFTPLLPDGEWVCYCG